MTITRKSSYVSCLPMRRLLRPATVLLVSFGLTAYTTDDGRPWRTPGTFLEEQPLSQIDHLTSRCPVFRREKSACRYDHPVLREDCVVVETRELGVLGNSQYLMMRTLESVTYDEGKGNSYTCKADGAALIEIPRDSEGKGRLVWHDATEREFQFISAVNTHTTPEGKVILDILYCMNGTGGCAQGILLWTATEGWHELARDGSWPRVYEHLPAGYRPHKSPAIDFGNMTWEQHLAGPADPNCCPTGRINFNLALVDDKLSVTSYAVSVPQSEIIAQGRKRLAARRVSELDRDLPDKPFEEWLRSHLPKEVELRYGLNDCGEQTGAPARDRGRGLPECLAVEAEITSRARTVELLFHDWDLRFRSGAVFSNVSDEVIDVPGLFGLKDALTKPIQPAPLACRKGTTNEHKEEYAGLYEWCENRQGQKHGPYRSWFSTGIYLMNNGQYDSGVKVGDWIECSRFEHCILKRY